ncbi:MAG TPA: CocE/NonD family hydrolase, partial [Myxococcota bacterium]
MIAAILLALACDAPLTAPAGPLVPDELKTDDDVARALHEHYTKHEYEIPMRDGIKLHTDAWVPKDPGPWPFLITRTPYSVEPYGVENVLSGKNHRQVTRFAPSKELIRSGYIFVHQDVRGRLASEGTFVEVRPMADPAKKRAHDEKAIDESTDAWDTIDYLVKNVPHNNGRAGVWGISYPGFYAAQSAVDAHPALKAVAPMAPVTEWFIGDDFHHNGAFFLGDAFDFEANFGKSRPLPTRKQSWDFAPEGAPADLYDFFLRMGPLRNANDKYLHGDIAFWNDMLAHPNRDAWWQARDPRPQYQSSVIKPAVLVVGGWFDAEDLWGALH